MDSGTTQYHGETMSRKPSYKRIMLKLSGEAFAARSAIYDEVELKSRADAAAKGVKFLTADARLVDDLRRLGAPQRMHPSKNYERVSRRSL